MEWQVSQRQLDDYAHAESKIFFESLILSQSINKKMGLLHFATLTGTDTISKGSSFLLLKDEGLFNEEDYLVLNTRTEYPATETEAARVDIGQTWWTITGVLTAKNAPGVKRGFAMVKLKRAKNPIPKKAENTEEVDAEVNEG